MFTFKIATIVALHVYKYDYIFLVNLCYQDN